MTIIGLLAMGFMTGIIFCFMGIVLAQASVYKSVKSELTKEYSYALLICFIGLVLCLITGNIIY